MFTVTLDYIAPPGLQPLAVFLARVTAVDVFDGELELLGFDLVSSTTTILGSVVRRRIVLQTNAQGDAMYPTAADVIDVTRGLYTQALGVRTPALFAAAVPTVGP